MNAWRGWLVMAAVAFPASVLAQRELEPGNWHIVTKATKNGKAQPDQVQDECLRDELKDLAGYFAPALEGINAKCNRTSQKAPANSIAYKMRCNGKGFTIDVESAINVVGPRHFTASLKMNTKTARERALVVAKIEGKHTGACKP